MKKFLQAISIIGVTLLAIYLVQIFNVFKYISIVPVDIVEETGLTAYISILELFREWVFDWAEKHLLDSQNTITCVFSIKGDVADVEHVPVVEMRDGNDSRSIDISIKIKGKKKKISSGKIQIRFPDWIDIQNSNRGTKAKVEGRTWFVSLSDIVDGSGDYIDLDRKYTLSLIKNSAEDGLNDIVKFEYDQKRFWGVKYANNTLTIRNIR